MTIAIGLLATDGVVLASDTQEIIGSMKSDESKMLIANRGLAKEKAGAIVVTGAGDSGYLDSIAMDICSEFNVKKAWTGAKWTKAIKKQVKEFHRDHVIPFAKFPEHDRPLLALIIGASFSSPPFTDYRALWVTEKSTVSGPKQYCAVGLGRASAYVMLRRYFGVMDTIRAASLAAYIIFHVKRSVDGCGNETQIVVIKDGYAAHISSANVEMLEHHFDEMAAYENELVHFGIGMEVPEEDVRLALSRFSHVLLKNRNAVMQCQNFTMTSYRRGKRPVDQPELRRQTDDPDSE